MSAAARPVHAPKLGEMRGALEGQVTRNLFQSWQLLGYLSLVLLTGLMARAAANPTRRMVAMCCPGTVLFQLTSIITVGFDKGVIDLRWS